MGAPLNCQLCPRLVKSRRMVVNGAGSLPNRVVIIGQNPGRREEIEGEPLIGWSGNKLVYYASLAGLVDLPDEEEWGRLTKEEREGVMTVARQSLRRENVVRCRPPKSLRGGGDEAPTAKEIKNCRPFLEELLDSHSPEFIVTLGSPAWKWFGNDNPLSSAHGLTFHMIHPYYPFNVHDVTSYTVIPMWHPAAAAGGRRSQLAVSMEMDWTYLGHVLRGDGQYFKQQFLDERLEFKFNEINRSN